YFWYNNACLPPSNAKKVSGKIDLASSSKGVKERYRAEKWPINNFLAATVLAISPAWSAVVWKVSSARVSISFKKVASWYNKSTPSIEGRYCSEYLVSEQYA